MSFRTTTCAWVAGMSASESQSSRRSSETRAAWTGSPSGPARRSSASCSVAAGRPPLGRVAARVHDEPVQPGRELGLAAELLEPDAHLREGLLRGVAGVFRVAEQVPGEPLDLRRMPFAQRFQREPVAVLRSCHQDGIAELLVDEAAVLPQRLPDRTAVGAERLHDRTSLERRVGSDPRDGAAAPARPARDALPLRRVVSVHPAAARRGRAGGRHRGRGRADRRPRPVGAHVGGAGRAGDPLLGPSPAARADGPVARAVARRRRGGRRGAAGRDGCGRVAALSERRRRRGPQARGRAPRGRAGPGRAGDRRQRQPDRRTSCRARRRSRRPPSGSSSATSWRGRPCSRRSSSSSSAATTPGCEKHS